MRDPRQEFIIVSVVFLILFAAFVFVVYTNESIKREERKKPCEEYTLTDQPPRCWEE